MNGEISRFLAIDLETADSKNAAPCSIGIVVMENGSIAEEVLWYIDPETDFNPYAMAVHGITPDMVAGKPALPGVWDELCGYLSGAVVVAHNADFDLNVLQKAALRYGLSLPPFEVFCTLALSKQFLAIPSHKLKDVCSLLGIQIDHCHDALCDARACALVMQRYIDAGLLSKEPPADRPPKRPHHRPPRAKACTPSMPPADTANADRTPLWGRTVVFTGNLPSIPRHQAIQIAVNCGAVIRGSVSSKTDYLVVGEQDLDIVGLDGMSTKQERALELNNSGKGHIQVIDEAEFLRLANRSPSPVP